MRKILIAALAASAALPGVASAQGMGEIRRGQQEVRAGQREVQRDVARGDMREAREDRRELREDWQDYRQRNREVFRGGRYYAPRGYRYRPVTVGYTFRPAFYSNRYWVGNPGRYRLNTPGRNQRWIRYGNDVILINERNGRVLIIHRNFFW